MIHPGHPLMLTVSDIVLEQHSNLMRQGAILVDPADDSEALFLLLHQTYISRIETKAGIKAEGLGVFKENNHRLCCCATFVQPRQRELH